MGEVIVMEIIDDFNDVIDLFFIVNRYIENLFFDYCVLVFYYSKIYSLLY